MDKEKIKIAFVTPLMIIGGAETYVINKCEWLLAHGFNVIVISEGGENVSHLPQGTLHILLEGISLPPLVFTKNQYTDFKKKFATLLLDHKIDVIEAHNSYPIVHVASVYKDTKIPFCLNVLSELSYSRNPLLKIITKKLNEFGLFYLLTHQMNQFIEKATNKKLNAVIIPIPVKAIPKIEANSDSKYILSVSRLSRDKDYVRYLIQDFYELYKENKVFRDYKLIIVGDGNLYDELNEIASTINIEVSNKIILLKGTVVGNDLEILYQNCTMFVGMGTTLLLAASCGKPSIIAGFTPETSRCAWGFWGENDLDANIIAINSSKERISTSFQLTINSILLSDARKVAAGDAALKMFKSNYDYDSIMRLWKDEYIRISEVFKLNGSRIENSLKYYDFYIRFYRLVRRAVKIVKV